MTGADFEHTALVADAMVGDLAARREALESALPLLQQTLYPALWRELTILRARNRELEDENALLRGRREDETPTQRLPPVPAAKRHRRLRRGRP